MTTAAYDQGMGISRKQALDCFASDDLIGIGMEADAVRRRLHPEGVVTYSLDRAIALTDDLPGTLAQIAEAEDRGNTGILLRGAGTRDLAWFERLLTTIRLQSPTLGLQALSAIEITEIATNSGLPLSLILGRLRAAGLDAISGDGPETLGIAPWIAVHRAAHHAGILSTAAMVFGAGEPVEARINLLEATHTLQQETNGFTAFSLSSFHAPGGRDLDDATAVEYLKTLAICRMVLDNIPHIQTNWEQQGLKVLQMGLRFGANDAGSVLGLSADASEEEIRRLIRDAGFRPAQRDSLYRSLFLN